MSKVGRIKAQFGKLNESVVIPSLADPYPVSAAERDQWILARRPSRRPADPTKPQAFFAELERMEDGEVAAVATILLTDRECAWRCLMCDLWKSTFTHVAPLGAIPLQIDFAIDRLQLEPSLGGATRPRFRQLKLYNSGSFFDVAAVPPGDHQAIAHRACGFERTVVECHPALVGTRCVEFQRLLTNEVARVSSNGRRPVSLEIAMGLETAHPGVLQKLNKRMSLDLFRSAAEYLRRHDISLRVFVLVKPPFLSEEEALLWTERSIDFAFDCGASVVSLIPTRSGNGALEALAHQGQWTPPRLRTLENALHYGIGLGRGRVFADLWDLKRFSSCDGCFEARLLRLREMNWSQALLADAECGLCGTTN